MGRSMLLILQRRDFGIQGFAPGVWSTHSFRWTGTPFAGRTSAGDREDGEIDETEQRVCSTCSEARSS